MIEMRIPYTVAVLLLLVVFSPVTPPTPGTWAAVVRGTDTYRLEAVKLEGVQQVSKRELERRLVARTPPAWRFWEEKTVVTRQDPESDILRIQQFYRSMGYYHTTCSYQITTETDQTAATAGDGGTTNSGETAIPRATLTYTIVEGPPVTIEQIDLTIMETAQPAFRISRETLYEQMPLQVGRIFVVESFNETKRWLLRYLGDRGYPLAEMESQARVNTSRNTAYISLDLKPGPPCRFGGLSVSGNERYVKQAIIEQALTFERGDIFSRKKLDTSQRNLFNLDIFSVARITPGEPERGTTEVPIRIQVKPRKRQKVLAGLGYGTEDGVRVKGGWTYRNLSGWADRISVTAKRSDLVRGIQAEYDLPYFLDPKNAFSASIGFEEEILETYENRQTSGRTTVTRYLSENWTAELGYDLEINDVEVLDITFQEASQLGASEGDYFISAVEPGITRHTADSEIDPTKGSICSLYMEAASGLLASEVSYLKPTLRMTKYHRLLAGIVAAGRLRLRAIYETEDTEDIPVFKRLFLGGSNSVRGYGYQKLGPVGEDGTPLGGVSALDANIELRFPLYQKFSGVAFVDMGLVDKTSFRYRLDDMRYSCGVGLRYHTIIGPIRADFGYKLNPPSKQAFGESGNPDEAVEDRWKIHLSVGHAF